MNLQGWRLYHARFQTYLSKKPPSKYNSLRAGVLQTIPGNTGQTLPSRIASTTSRQVARDPAIPIIRFPIQFSKYGIKLNDILKV
jgi:hypothetical protein